MTSSTKVRVVYDTDRWRKQSDGSEVAVMRYNIYHLDPELFMSWEYAGRCPSCGSEYRWYFHSFTDDNGDLCHPTKPTGPKSVSTASFYGCSNNDVEGHKTICPRRVSIEYEVVADTKKMMSKLHRIAKWREKLYDPRTKRKKVTHGPKWSR